MPLIVAIYILAIPFETDESQASPPAPEPPFLFSSLPEPPPPSAEHKIVSPNLNSVLPPLPPPETLTPASPPLPILMIYVPLCKITLLNKINLPAPPPPPWS